MSSATGSDASGDDDLEVNILEVISFYQTNQLAQYIAVSAFSFLLFDYLLTFDREVRYVWGHKRTWAKVVFVLNRYISLLQALAALLSVSLPATFFVCVFLQRTIEACQVSLYAVWAVFSALRVYALSDNQRVVAMLVGLLSLGPVSTYIAISVFAYLEVDSISKLDPPPNVCYSGFMASMQLYQTRESLMHAFVLRPVQSLTHVFFLAVGVITHGALMLAEVIVIVVTFIRTWDLVPRQNRSQMVRLPRLILKEGILYFLSMVLINSTQVVSDFLQEARFEAACVIFNLLVPILVSRFYFNLDDVRRAEAENKPELERTKTSPWKLKPLPSIPEFEVDDTKVRYVDEVFQYNGRVLGRSATYA